MLGMQCRFTHWVQLRCIAAKKLSVLCKKSLSMRDVGEGSGGGGQGGGRGGKSGRCAEGEAKRGRAGVRGK